MLNLALLVGKFAFLGILYLFVIMVVRALVRDTRSAAPDSVRVTVGDGAPSLGMTGLPSTDAFLDGVSMASGLSGPTGAWALAVAESQCVPPGAEYLVPAAGHLVIGRSPAADVVLPDTFVSSSHARVTAEASGLVVEDLGSTNGTLVGGREVGHPVLVGPGEAIAVGDTVFVVQPR